MWTVLRAADLKSVPWRNGQGTTRDILTVSAPHGRLLWQVSIADLVRDADFSDFTGFERIFTPIANPVELSFDDGLFAACPALAPVPFAGETRTRCRVRNGPTQAFNAVWDRTAYAVTVGVLHVASGGRIKADGAISVLHCLQGMIALGGGSLEAGDSGHGPGSLDASALSDVIAIQVSVS